LFDIWSLRFVVFLLDRDFNYQFMTKDGCIICGSDLVYSERSEVMQCSICKGSYDSNAKCTEGHFVCDACHEMEGFDYISAFCCISNSTNPVEIADQIMGNPKIKLHGPEHHFLVPAVLLTAYYNKTGKPEMIREKLRIARQRAKVVLGGFCGFYGTCGAAIGTGIFMSVMSGATPLSKEEWTLSNRITAACLYEIANIGGPRCCKRVTYLALGKAVEFIEEHLDVILDPTEVTCSWYKRNKECISNECPFFPGNK